MSTRDLYEILGVSRGTPQAEIKSAYRKLAKQFHPDRNPGNKPAEERFKEASAAFEVLSDPKRRALYDEFGPDSLRSGFDEQKAEAARRWRTHGGNGGGGAPFDMGDLGDFSRVHVGGVGDFDFGSIFGDLFGNARRGRGPGRMQPAMQGQDAEAAVEVELRDAVLGGELDVKIGAQKLRVKIPAGVTEGSKIRLSGQGGTGMSGGGSGDLYLVIKLREHPLVRRVGRDLYLDLPVTVPEAVNGTEVTAPTFEGPVRLKIPPGSQSGTQLRLRGRGMPDLKSDARGDLYAVLKLLLPELSDTLKAAVEPIAALYKADPRAGLSL